MIDDNVSLVGMVKEYFSSINDINIIDLRRKIGTILQDPFIYAKSLKDNVKLFDDISDEKINEAQKIIAMCIFVAIIIGNVIFNIHIVKETGEYIFIAGEIDAIAVTYGPGLIGSLLVGMQAAKTLSYIYNNHPFYQKQKDTA